MIIGHLSIIYIVALKSTISLYFTVRDNIKKPCYLDGEGIQVVEHHMVGLWKKRRVTLVKNQRERVNTLTTNYS